MNKSQAIISAAVNRMLAKGGVPISGNPVTYTIIHGESLSSPGTFGLSVIADNPDWKATKCVANVSGIKSAALADQRAHDYAASYGATIETPMLTGAV